MGLVQLMFGFHGRIGRGPFLVGLLAAIAVLLLGIHLSLAALPAMARVLAPQGINAAFVLNGIWSVLGLFAVWTTLALTMKRLHDRGLSGWWAAASVLPLAGLALLNDAIFLVSRHFVLPAIVHNGVLAIAGALGLWVLVQTLLFGPAQDAAD